LSCVCILTVFVCILLSVALPVLANKLVHSPNRVDDAAEESFQNPEPPKELAAVLLNADNIGGTVFSKHWLFTTLMRLLEVAFCIINVSRYM